MGTAIVVVLATLAVILLIRVTYLVVTRPCQSGLHRHRHWHGRKPYGSSG